MIITIQIMILDQAKDKTNDNQSNNRKQRKKVKSR
jgi:hypothetical protein